MLLKMPRESNAGEAWLARYFAGMSAWEFRTATVRCDGLRLVLAPSEEVQVSNRRRFPRVAVRLPALLAHLPLLRREDASGRGGLLAGGGLWVDADAGGQCPYVRGEPRDGIGGSGAADRDALAGARGRPCPGGISVCRRDAPACRPGG